MQIDLYLRLADVQRLCYLLISFAFDVAQQHNRSLNLGQAVHESPYERDFFTSLQLFMRRLAAKMYHFIEIFGITSSTFHHIDGSVSARRYGKCLEIVYPVPVVATLPNLQEGVLHHIFGLCLVHRNAQSKTVKPVAQWQNGGSEADVFHLSIYEDDSGLQMLQP